MRNAVSPVFPCHEPVAGPKGVVGCSCGKDDCASIGKHPRTQRGKDDATTDAKGIEAWWRRWPTANIGVVTGRQNKLLVVDIDSPAGEGHLAALADARGNSRAAHGGQEQRTGRGRQLLYRYEGSDIRNSAAIFGPGSGVDVRAEGGYVIVAPSLHATGKHYELTDIGGPHELDPPAAPDWLLDVLRNRGADRARGELAQNRRPIGTVSTGGEH